MFPEILIIVILFGILIFLIISTLKNKHTVEDSLLEGFSFDDDDDIGEDTHPCPLCEKALRKGERVHSVIYNRGEDRLMNIYGCPWCYSDHPAGCREPLRDRRCPSCKVLFKEGNFAIARVFERPGRKMHVHVLGCPVCRHKD
ncbi:hypothetical protein EXM22_15005 [Oceanispirochaeta crateris]|uniref:Uncharacterized protein n=1 Tax=Oceanispirochaeta crateris TaxID=2518645 RepID=A0A5C1QM94_9SPIO|nr:hypothetical protein [Oceanispirochaeta crateris]QEN09225.1 hypothetical protein EXM22_15005 [Oceanispirochaeta crateris]